MKRLVKRAWGWYWTILDRKHFKVKILRFYRDRSCSLQYHKLRYELWLFLKGDGAFRKAHHYDAVGAGDYKTVSKYVEHKYYAKTPTIVLEIQYGALCDEQDIVRI